MKIIYFNLNLRTPHALCNFYSIIKFGPFLIRTPFSFLCSNFIWRGLLFIQKGCDKKTLKKMKTQKIYFIVLFRELPLVLVKIGIGGFNERRARIATLNPHHSITSRHLGGQCFDYLKGQCEKMSFEMIRVLLSSHCIHLSYNLNEDLEDKVG